MMMATFYFWYLTAIGCLPIALCSFLNGLQGRTLTEPTEVETYVILSSQQIEDQLQQWATKFPNLTRLTTAQDKYNLPRAGGADDCPFVEGDGCPNSILTIQDFIAHPEGSESSNRLPEVLWSGEVHGDEQVGPTSVIKAADLLLRATSCLALPRLSVRKETPSEWDDEVAKAKECRKDLEDFGIGDQDMWWLGRLVSTRRIVVVPTANSLGYYRTEREEEGIDPNRDFPYDYPPTNNKKRYNSKCMQTIAARTLNEVFREHMFQLSLTFHGGMEVIGYEWGAPSYKKYEISPDDTVQNQVAAAYSRFGGEWEGTVAYRYGPMNSRVYPVQGGMEDWAYAGSWDSQRVIPCHPDTFTDYPLEKTKYNNATLRVLNMLVETSNSKIPKSDDLGSSADLLKEFSVVGNGHISRNIRLALLAAELVQPWLSIRRVNGVPLLDDIIPLMNRTGQSSCQQFKLVTVPCYGEVIIEWTVGGSLYVDDSRLWYGKWSDLPDLNCLDQPPLNIEKSMMEGKPISSTNDDTRFSASAKTPRFSASMDLSGFEPDDKIVVLVSARVDQKWGTQPTYFEPKGVPPQSHMANARTNPNWYYKSGEKVIQGRLDWFSSPLTVEMGVFKDAVDAVEMSVRLPPAWSSSLTNSSEVNAVSVGVCLQPTSSSSFAQRATTVMVTLSLFIAAGFVIRCILRERIRHGQRTRVRRFIADEDAPTPGSTQISEVESEDTESGPYRDEPVDSEDRNGVEMERYT
ncbi:hypothetical protein ACA910_012899 [Epithemia clementina (nom. ined.)]